MKKVSFHLHPCRHQPSWEGEGKSPSATPAAHLSHPLGPAAMAGLPPSGRAIPHWRRNDKNEGPDARWNQPQNAGTALATGSLT